MTSIPFVSETSFHHGNINIHPEYKFEKLPISFIRTARVQWLRPENLEAS